MSREYKSVDDIICNGEHCPLPLDVIPNNMGVSLSCVEGVGWENRDDGQLKELIIYFRPSNRKYFPFGDAIKALREGKKVTRKGWNGNGMFLALAYPSYDDKRLNETIHFNKKYEDVTTSLNNFIVMKTADNRLIPWVASQTDMLAADWMVIK